MATRTPENVVGVVGSPISQSLSPILHGAAFEAMGLNWLSQAYEIHSGDGREVLRLMQEDGVLGLSVTMPLKEEMVQLVDRLGDEAQKIGSVNCLVKQEGGIFGTTTDGPGLLAALERSTDRTIQGSMVAIAGSGGAARSVAASFAAAGAREVCVVARSAHRSAVIASIAGMVGRVGKADDARTADFVVNTTPIGMKGTKSEGERPLIGAELLNANQVVVDLIYSPRETPWLQAARDQGAVAIGGLGMLVHQAALAIELWTGLSAPVEEMWSAAEGAVAS